MKSRLLQGYIWQGWQIFMPGFDRETFVFGIVTGITLSATVQYFVSLFTSSNVPNNFVQGELFSKSSNFATSSAHKVADKLDKEFTLSSTKMKRIALHMISEFKKGLESDGHVMKMIPSFVVNLPTGEEKGTVLALDMGGTNFRVMSVTLEGSGRTRSKQAKYTLTNELKKTSGPKLFDFFAECVDTFIKQEKIAGPYKLGFTFSFAVAQTSINRGTLMTWAKGFENEGVVGNDVVLLLEEAFKRRKLPITVTALVNDTVGTLVTHAYQDSFTYVSVILGTGTNAAYVEKQANVTKWKQRDNDPDAIVVVNTEWGAYGEPSVLPITSFDSILDRQTENPRKHVFEKMISGLYMGELARLVMLHLVDAGDLFNGVGSVQLSTPYQFETAFMSRIERDHSIDLNDTKNLLEDTMGIKNTSLDDRKLVKHISELIGTRAARLAAAGITAILSKINKLDNCTVAIDGSVFEHYPHFPSRMKDALRELLGITANNITLEQARDGSGLGAALIAALH